MAVPDNVVQITQDDIRPAGPLPGNAAPPGDASSVLDSLAAQLERAIHARDEALSELGQVRNVARSQTESLTAERDAAVNARDAIVLDFEKIRAQLEQQRTASKEREKDSARERKETAALIARERDEHKTQLAGLTQLADSLSRKLADLAEQFGRTQQSLEVRINSLTAQREQAEKERVAALEDAERTRVTLQRKIDALEQESALLAAQRDEAASVLETTTQTAHQQHATLAGERDALFQQRDAAAAELAKARQDFAAKWSKATADAEVKESEWKQFLQQSNAEIAAAQTEIASWRELHEKETAALAKARDEAIAQRNELRELRDVSRVSHEREVSALHDQLASLAEQRDRSVDELSHDQDFHSQQHHALARERDIVGLERDEARATLTARVEMHNRELAVLTAERTAIAEQRDEAWRQIERMRETHRQQTEALRRERDGLIDQHGDVAAQLTRFTAALGEDRATGLREQSDAVRQLATMKEQHQEELARWEEQFAELEKTRDEALARLSPYMAIEQVEQETFGSAAARKYEVGGRVASEPGGTVVRAVDGIAEREVVMKIAEVIDGSPALALRELLREARTLARLDHPGILPLYEIGLDENGHPFYTSRATDGITLRQILDEIEEGRTGTSIHFTLRRLLTIFQRACDAIAYAHAQGVVHGGLQPGHLVVGNFGEVFVTGWTAAGNAAYSDSRPAPEVDVRALGRILYEMVTLEKAPDHTQLAREKFAANKKSPGKSARAAEPHLRRHDALGAILLRAAERAIGRHGGRPHFSVRELQREVDAYSTSFDDPTERMTIAKVVVQLMLERRWFFTALAIVLLTILAWLGNFALKLHPLRAGWMHEALTHQAGAGAAR